MKQYASILIPLLLLLTSSCSHIRPSIKHPTLARSYAPQKVDTLSGEYITVPYLKRLTLLDFWATYCKPCHKQLPALKDLYQRYHKKGLFVVGISENTNPIKVSRYVKKHDIPWPMVVDGQHKTFLAQYQVRKLPLLILLDPTGKVIQVRGSGKKAIKKLEKSILLYLQ